LQINYCDLCSQPLHQERHILLIVEEKDFGITQQGRIASPRTTYEVCTPCVQLIHKIFTLKKKKLAEIEQFIEDTYKLPAKQPTVKKAKRQRKYKITRGHK
jgi:hypothetical protein